MIRAGELPAHSGTKFHTKARSKAGVFIGASMLYISNAFSLQMLPEWAVTPGEHAGVSINVVPVEDPRALIEQLLCHGQEPHSIIGHADTAAVAASILGRDVPMNRESVTLSTDDDLLVMQVTGGRLPEGATSLPEGFTVRWLLVSLES